MATVVYLAGERSQTYADRQLAFDIASLALTRGVAVHVEIPGMPVVDWSDPVARMRLARSTYVERGAYAHTCDAWCVGSQGRCVVTRSA